VASGSLTGHILDVSLRATLLEFSRQEEGRLTIDADRLLEHFRHLGYELSETATAISAAEVRAPPAEDAPEFDWAEDTTWDAGDGSAPMEEDAATSETGADSTGSVKSSGTAKALEEVQRFAGDLSSPRFEAAMAHEPLR
jgi:hypothetical protein